MPRVVQEETNFDHNNLRAKVDQEYDKLNKEQKHVFDAVIQSVDSGGGRIFALNASGGTGKTHTINLILAAVRSKKKIALATALSGIAATLLSNGRTLHSRCKISLDITRCVVFHQETRPEAFFNAANSSLLMKCQWDINMFSRP